MGAEQKAALDRIVAIVSDQWKKESRATHLAYLGQLLAKEIPDFKKSVLAGETLRSFIEKNLSKRLTIVTLPDDAGVVGVVPASSGAGPETLATPPDKANPPRFNPAVWAAFIKQVQPGHKRVVYLEPEISFDDLQSEAATPAGAHIIPEDLTAKGPDESVEKVAASIEAWASKLEIPIEKLRIRKRSTTQSCSEAGPSGRRSLLDDLLDALDAQEMRRLTVPLDIIAKLKRAASVR